MAKSWKPNPYKPPKEAPKPHVITEYERQLIRELCPAIQGKNLIRFWYNDITTNFEDWRLIEPYLIGQTKYKHANIWLVGWFLPTGLQMIDGHEEKWGNYVLEDISKVEILEQRYRFTRPQYNRNDGRMTSIICATSYAS